MKYLLLVLTIALLSCNNSRKPLFLILPTKISLDTLKANTENNTSFKIFNKGGKDLIIYNYSASCECTIVSLMPNTIIKPHDSILVNLKVKTFIDDIGKTKRIICTFKNNSDSIFNYLPINFYTK